MGFEPILSESQSEVLTANTKVTPKKITTIEKHTQVRGSEGTIPTMACASPSVFIYGRGTENRTRIYWLKASYSSR